MAQHRHAPAPGPPLARIVRAAKQHDLGRAHRGRQMRRSGVATDEHVGLFQQRGQFDHSGHTRPIDHRGPRQRAEYFLRDRTFTGSANQHDLRFQVHDSVEAALTALEAGQLDAVVYDAPILHYLATRRPARGVTVLPRVFERQDYAFVVRSGSALREPLNLAILESLEDPKWRETLSTYLGR